MKLYIPNELIDIILEYEGRLCYVNGKFQINTDNKIYDSIKFGIEHKQFLFNHFPYHSVKLNKIYNHHYDTIVILFSFDGKEEPRNEKYPYIYFYLTLHKEKKYISKGTFDSTFFIH